MRRFVYVLGLAFLGATPPASAQQPPSVEIEGLIVTGTSVPRARAQMGSSVTVIDGDELRARNVSTVLDALREVPGLAVVRGGSFGAIGSVFMRGGESDYVQVLVDGVKVNQPGGAFDFSSLTTENVERIEIVRGPSSALSGSDAMAGVIHVITRAGTGAPKASVTFQAGSFGRDEWTGVLSGGTNTAAYGFSISRSQTDGILAFNNGFENTVLSGNVKITPDDVTTIRLSTRLADREFHFPTDGSGNVVDQNAFTFADEASVAVEASRWLSDRFELRASLTSYEVDGGSDDRADGPADTTGFFGFTSLDASQRTSAELRSNVTLNSTTVGTLGVEFESQAQRSFSESLSQYGTSNGQSENDRWNRGAFAHLVTEAGPLSMNGGLRIEDNERFGRLVTWQLGFAYPFTRSARVRGVAGRAIKEPTFFENYAAGFATGNPDLDPERSSSWEVGIEQDLLDGSIRLEATYFDQAFRDLIQYTSSPPQPTDPHYFNVAEANARGIEAGASITLGAFFATANLTWLDTEVVDSGFDEGPSASFVVGERLLRRPKNVLGGSVRYSVDQRASVSATMLRVGDRTDRDFSAYPADPVTLDAYSLLSVGGRLTLVEPASGRPGFDVTIRGENLLGSSYQEVFGFSAPGRGLYAGGRITFGAG
jgi:vitamin B12 transporter